MAELTELLNRTKIRGRKKFRLKKAVKTKLYLAGGAILIFVLAVFLLSRFFTEENEKPGRR